MEVRRRRFRRYEGEVNLKRIIAAAGLTCLALVAQAPAPALASGKIFPYDAHEETLDNGLKVILIPMASDGLVALWSVVRTGSRDEYEPGRTGFAHFFEHMMFRGTESFPADRYNEIVTEMGADANAFTSNDLTAYHMGIAAVDLDRALEIEADRFQNLSYAEEAFRTEAGAVFGEYRKNRTRPFTQIIEAVYGTAFTNHTYGHSTIGYEADIKGMPDLYDYSKSFFSRYYRPENTVLLITGDIEIEPTMALIRTYYGNWQRGYVAPQIPVEPEQTEARSVSVDYEGKSLPIVWVAYKTPAFDPKDRVVVAASLLADLAFGSTSDIYKKLVLDEQTVEFIDAGVDRTRDPFVFEVYSRVKDPDKVDAVLGEIDGVIAHYSKNPPDAKRLHDLKSRLKYGFLMGLDTPDRVASRLARYIAVSGGIDAIEELYRTFKAITPEDLQTAAQRYLVTEKRTIGVLRGKR